MHSALEIDICSDIEAYANQSLGALVCAKCSLETFRASLVAGANDHNVPENVILTAPPSPSLAHLSRIFGRYRLLLLGVFIQVPGAI
jgi:hypothetical protein